MLLHNLIASFTIFVLVTGALGYALVRVLEALFPLSSRIRQLLYAAVMVLPLTAFIMDMVHWTEVCASYAAHIIEELKLSLGPHGSGLKVLSVLAILGYAAYLLARRPMTRGNPKLSSVTGYRERVNRLLVEMGAAEHRSRIYRTSYPIACVVGITKPTICLSHGVLEVMDDRELRAVLAHELAHISGKDNVLNLAVQVVKHLTFFSPAAHLAASRYAIAREEAADDLAALMVGESADLASALVKIVRRVSGYARILQPVFEYSSFLESELALHRAERIITEPYKQHRNVPLEQSLLFAVTAVIPMLFC